MPAVSVIIPTWNRAPYIRRAVESVARQAVEDWEIVIVDDGSTDDTAAAIAPLVTADPRVRCVRHDAQRGAQAARNTGIRAARGRFLAFLDSDDEWLPESLARRLRLASAHGLVCVHSECLVHRPGKSAPEPMGLPAMNGQVYKQLLASPGPMFQSLLVARSALDRIGGLDENIVAYQEWDTSIRLARHYAFGFLPEPTFLYDCRPTETISKNLRRGAAGYEQVCRKHRGSTLLHLGPRGVARHYQLLQGMYENARAPHDARRCRTLALLWWPFRRTLARAGLHRLAGRRSASRDQ